MSALRRSRVREIGQYEVLQRLRSGGMATLYLALRRREDGISEKVAIKVIHDHLADRPEFLAMFETEAQIQSRIHHPNVVEVEEFGTTDDDEPFLVMQWVDGASVAQLLTVLHRREEAMPIELAVRIAMEVAAGLHAAHALADDEGRPLGVVHRDVSPDNVLLSRAGEIKLIDFGVAKVRTGLRTMTGVLKGKVRYMSPEQARSGPVDARTDVYALGVVLWEMLTTRRLFEEADHVLALEAVRRSAIAPPSVHRSEIPAALDAVVMSALRAHPAERPASADELRRALARVVPGALALAPASITSLLVASGLVEPPPPIEPDTDLHATSELLPSPTAPEIVVPSDDSGAFTWQRLAPLRVEPGDWLEDDSEVVDTNELPRPPQLLAPEPTPVPVRVASPPARPAAPARPWLPWLAAAVVVPVALWLAFAWVDAMESRRPLPALAAPSSPPATTVDGPAASPSARSEAPREIAPREAPTHAARADGPSLPSDVAPVTATSDPSEHERPATAGERARGETSAPNSSEELGGLLAPTIRRERRPRPLETEF